jgi:hypothetical protein
MKRRRKIKKASIDRPDHEKFDNLFLVMPTCIVSISMGIFKGKILFVASEF